MTVAVLTLEAPSGPAWLFFGVFAAVVAGPVVAGWLRLPPIIGLLAGGLVIGPEVLGIVPATDTTVRDLGQLGLLYLMFSAGVELDLAQFERYRRAALSFGLLTFAAPMMLGVAGGLLLDFRLAAALLLGSLWASHTLVNYPMVRKAGLAGDPAVASTVGATVLTDSLSLVVLAGVAGSATGDADVGEILAGLVLGFAVLVAYCGVVLPRAARWFFAGRYRSLRRPRRFRSDGATAPAVPERTLRYAFLLVALLSAAVLSEAVGIEPIVGAFFAGLGLNRFVPAGSVLGEHLEFVGSSLLIPIFLVSVGVIIDPSVVVQPDTLGLAGVFAVAALGGKAIAAAAARPVLGFSPAQAGLMFSLSGAQAAATLAATFVGFNVGLFGRQVVNAVLVVILVTLLVSAISTARFVRRIEAQPAEAGGLGRTVVVPVPHEDRLSPLARLASKLVQREGGLVVPVRVTLPDGDVVGDQSSLALAEAVLAAEGLDAAARLRIDRDVTGGVVNLLHEAKATLLLMDWQATSRHQPILRGQRDDELLAACPVPVALAAMCDTPVARVVLTLDETDLEPESATAVALAADIAHRLCVGGTPLLAVGVDADALAPMLGGRVSPAIEPSRLERSAWMAGDSSPGDLVVVPAQPHDRRFSHATVLATSRPGVSVLVVADSPQWASHSPVAHGLGVLQVSPLRRGGEPRGAPRPE